MCVCVFNEALRQQVIGEATHSCDAWAERVGGGGGYLALELVKLSGRLTVSDRHRL